MRRANSYQPPSVLASHFEVGSLEAKPGIQPQEYVRPKRVSTSTGHQRPALPDMVSSVQLGMAQSGFIPVLRSSPTHSSGAVATDGIGLAKGLVLGSSSNPLGYDGHVSPPSPPGNGSMSVPTTRTLPANAILEGRSTPGTSSLGTNHSRRSRTSSISEETRSHIVVHTLDTSNPSLNTLVTTGGTNASTTLQIAVSNQGEELQAIMTSPSLASPPSNPVSPAVLASMFPPKGSLDEKARLQVESALAGIELGSDSSSHTSTSQHSNPHAHSDALGLNSRSDSSKGDGFAQDTNAVSFNTSTPTSSTSSKPITDTSSTLSNGVGPNPLHKLVKYSTAVASSAPAVVATVKPSSQTSHGVVNHSTGASMGVTSSSNQGTSSDGKSLSSETKTAGGNGMRSNITPSMVSDSSQMMAEGVSVGSAHTNSGKSVAESHAETDSIASSSDDQPDEYSDDDDLGYVRVSASNGSRHLVRHLGVLGFDSSDSDDSMSSDESDISDSESDGSDDDGLRVSKGISKRTGPLKKRDLKGASGPKSVKTGRIGEKSQAGGDSAAQGSTMFHMDDLSSPAKLRRKAKVYAPSRWTSRPLPADGPTPYLKLPVLPTNIAPPSNTDFATVNVKRSRHEKDVTLEYFNMKIIYDRQKTGFEATHDFPIRIGDVIAGRYEIVEYLGSAAFSRAVKCIDHLKGHAVCLKIIKNNKDYFDQSLDEIKLLTLIKHQCASRCDDFHVLELFDYFYFKEHLFLVCELLRENLYEVYKYNRQSGETIYFNVPRLQRVAWQSLLALHFIHSKNLMHCDLKPENILIKSYSRSIIKVIDFGSSCFTSDQLSSYVQSRSYRAPEVVLGYPYDQRIDMWSLGCILAELWTGKVLFQNESLATLIAKHIGIIGLQKSDRTFIKEAPLVDDIFTRDGIVYEKKQGTNGGPSSSEYIQIKKTSIRKRLQTSDPLFFSFVSSLLRINPAERPTSWEAMHHPWFRHVYPEP